MSATVFAGIVTAIISALQTAPAVSTQIDRALLRPIAAAQTDAVCVRLLSSAAERSVIDGAPVDFVTTIAVECYARSATLAADLAADALMSAVYARIAEDGTLAGAVQDIYPSEFKFDFDAEAERTACVTITYMAHHRAANLTI